MKKGFVKKTLIVGFMFLPVFFTDIPWAWADNDKCNEAKISEIEPKNKEALEEMVGGFILKGWRRAKDALIDAKKHGCGEHKVTAMTHLLLGYVALSADKNANGRDLFNKALDLDPNLSYPSGLKESYQKALFAILKKSRQIQKTPLTPEVCNKAAIERLRHLMNEIFTYLVYDLVYDRMSECKAGIKQALALSKKQKCEKRNITAMIYLLKGVFEFRAGARTLRLQGWIDALKINPKISLPKRLQTRDTVAHFEQVKHFFHNYEWLPAKSFYDENLKTECRTDVDCGRDKVCREGYCIGSKRRTAGEEHGRGAAPTIAGGHADSPNRKSLKPPDKKKKRVFSNKGTVEFGLNGKFRYGKHSTEFEDYDEIETKSVQFSGELYLGYFLSDYFVFGAFIMSGASWSNPAESTKYTSVYIGGGIVPGLAFPVGDGAAFYVDGILGYGYAKSEFGSDSSAKTNSVVLGGESGVKIIVGRKILMRIGLRPTYWIGKNKWDEHYTKARSTDLYFDFVVGFSYWK